MTAPAREPRDVYSTCARLTRWSLSPAVDVQGRTYDTTGVRTRVTTSLFVAVTSAALSGALLGCAAPTHREAAEASAFTLAREHGRHVTVAGIETYVITFGKGPDVVLIHGNPSSTYTWRHWLPKLAERFRVHAIDLPGYGFSEKPAEAPYTASWMAGHVAAYLDVAGIDRAIVIGNSMGGEVASELAAIYPRRTAALVLLAPGGLPSDEVATPPLAYQLAKLPGMQSLAPFLPLRPMIARTLRSGYFDPALVTDADIEAYTLPLRSEGGLRALVSRAIRDDAFDRSMLVRTIRVPTLVVLGEIDRFVPLSVGRAYHSLIEGSRLVVVERAGHLPQEERPDETLDAIDTWLATLEK
jgi:pimeloyl-ACP methyl ester carboxylesterase